MKKLWSAVCHWFNNLGKTYVAPDAYLQGGGRDEIVYVHGNHRMRIYSELQTGKIERIIDRASLNRWQPPFDGESIQETEKDLILQRLCQHYEATGVKYKVH